MTKSSERSKNTNNNNNQNVPEIRFPEFEGEWTTYKLGDICKFSKGKGISKNDVTTEGTPCIRYGELYTQYNELISETVSKTQLPLDKLVLSEENDIIIPSTGETAIDISQASCIKKNNIAIGGDINILKTKEDGIFLSYYLNYIKTDIAKMAQGISVIHLYSDQLKSLSVNIPSIEEQKKISNLLLLLNQKIYSMEKKYMAYVNYKKVLIKNIFCDFESEIPLIYFNKEKWDEYSLDMLFNSLKGNGLSKDDIKLNGNFKALLYGDLYTTYNEIIENIVNFTDNDEGVLSKKYDILMPMSTTTKGIDLATASLLLEDNVRIGGDTLILRKKVDHVNEYFITYLMSNVMVKEISRLAQGTTIIHQYWKYLKKIKIKLPSLTYQNKIVQLLINIDNEIEHINCEIKLNKEFKRSLLSKMFC